MSDDQDEMTFEEAAELLEQAGDAASRDLLIDLLRDALTAVQGLSERVAVLEYRLTAKEGIQDAPWKTVPNTYPPYSKPHYPYTVNTDGHVFYSTNTTSSLREVASEAAALKQAVEGS